MLFSGKLDIVLAPANRDGNPPRIKAFVGRTQGKDKRPGPVERSNQVRVGDLLLKVNGKSVVQMNVKDIEKKIYSSDRGWFGNDDGDVSGEVVGVVGVVGGRGGED